MAVPFTKPNVDAAPQENGVYTLYDNGILIYIGCAWGDTGTIRGRLQRHHSGAEGPCTQFATHFYWWLTDYPLTTEKELLAAYKARWGALPRCNERIG